MTSDRLERVSGLLLLALLAQADAGVDFAAAVRDPARRTAAACEALTRAGKGYEGCALNHVVEVENDDGQPRFLVFFKRGLAYEREGRPLGHFGLFDASGALLRPFMDDELLAPEDRLLSLGQAAPLLVQERDWSVPCASGPPVVLPRLSVTALTGDGRSKLVLVMASPSKTTRQTRVRRFKSRKDCAGDVCSNAIEYVHELARVPTQRWNWRIDCTAGCALRIGTDEALRAGRAAFTLPWNAEMSRFDGPGDGDAFFRLESFEDCGFGLPQWVDEHQRRLAERYCGD